MSGGALGHLHAVMARQDVPHALLRERLALAASEGLMRLSGRPERAGQLRDEVHLLRPGDQPGPAGALYQQWRRAVACAISAQALHKALPEAAPQQIRTWLGAGRGAAVTRGAATLEAVLAAAPREEAAALILADAALARALGWARVVPLLAIGLTRRDLRNTGEELRRACHRAILVAAPEAARMAADLTKGAQRLRDVAPRLRAKGAGEAVDLFLCRDALSPSLALSRVMSDRAARRLCDRLVALGAVRELSGRDTFRLYGV